MLNVLNVGHDLRAHFYRAGVCFCSDDNSVYKVDVKTTAVSKLFELPSPKKGVLFNLRNFLARSWIRRRLIPNSSFDNLIVLSGGGVLVVYDQVYYFDPSTPLDGVHILNCFLAPGLATPLRGGVTEHLKSGRIYFGEYVNDARKSVRVFCADVVSKTVKSCWVFEGGEIKHVHAVHYDKFRDRLWILTGDLDRESAFYYTDDEFQSVHYFAGGDQTWRAIALMFDESGMEWGMDAGKDAPVGTINKIFRYDFSTEQRQELVSIDNPVYGAHEFDDGTALIQTAYEGGSRGGGDRHTSLWYRGHDRKWRIIFKLPFELNPRSGEGEYAQILIPRGVGRAGSIFCTPINTKKYNYRLLLLTGFE